MEVSREEFDELRGDVKQIKQALVGDDYGNNGYCHRISRLEKAVKSINIRVYMAIGGMAVLTFLINIIF